MTAAVAGDELTQIARAMATARSVLFITGAGISADSGLPTYRGIGGLYEEGDTEEDIPIEVALSGAMFARRPELTWKHIAAIESACREAKANRGHQVIAEIEKRVERAWVLTQNVDGFHRQAGSQNVIDIHGDLHDLECTRCQHRVTVADYGELEIPPRCVQCQAIMRPQVVLFGEMLPVDRVRVLERELARGFDVVFSIGTTSVFPYIAQPIFNARRTGKLTIEINPGRSEVSDLVDLRLQTTAAAALDAIWAATRDVVGT